MRGHSSRRFEDRNNVAWEILVFIAPSSILVAHRLPKEGGINKPKAPNKTFSPLVPGILTAVMTQRGFVTHCQGQNAELDRRQLCAAKNDAKNAQSLWSRVHFKLRRI